MEPGVSKPHSQVLSNNPNPETNQHNPSYWYFFKIHSNIVLPSTPGSSWRSVSCTCTCQNLESTPTFFHSGYMICPFQSYRFTHPDYIWWMVWISSLWSLLHYSLGPKYSPRDPVLIILIKIIIIIINKNKITLWLTASKGATPVN